MADIASDKNTRPVIKGVSYFLAQVPSMIRYGSKPHRYKGAEINRITGRTPSEEDLKKAIDAALVDTNGAS